MSHVVTIETQVRDPRGIYAACQRLQLCEPKHGTATLFADAATGWIVQLPNWRYPMVCQTETGHLRYDNYEGRWGDLSLLNSFLQAYAVEKTKLEVRKQGRHAVEQLLADGSIKLTIHVDA